MVKFDKDLAKFRFLCEIPTLEITPALEEEECHICKEPYQNNGWELGRTVHRPVALPCGHVLSFQCLALWMLSTNFNNHCSLCRAQICDPSKIREQLSPALASSFARLEVLAVTADNGISRIQKARLLKDIKESLRGDKDLCTMTENSDRIMVVWEEFLDKICNQSAAPDEDNPAAIRGHRVIANRLFGSWDQISSSFQWEDSIELLSWLCFYAVGLLVAVMGMLGSDKAGDDKTEIEMFGCSDELFIGCMVGLVVSTSRILWGYKIIPSVVVLVLMLRVLVELAGVFFVKDFRGVELLLKVTYRGL